MQHTPDFEIFADGINVTGNFSGRKMELEVVDAVGVESDSAEIVVADPQATLAPPRRGAKLAIAMGYRETGLVPMGLFTVDQVTLLGYPHTIRINARSADNKKELKERRIKDYTNKSFGQIVKEIAGLHGLQAVVAPAFAEMRFPYFSRLDQSYIAQHEESDASFLTRITQEIGGFFTIKDGKMIAAERGEGSSISGKPMIYTITPGKLIGRSGYEVSVRDKPVHGQIEASFFDRDKVQREPVIEGTGEGVVYRFRKPFPDKKTAQRAAKGKKRELERRQGSAKFEIWGDPLCRAEMTVIAAGIRPGVDGDWSCSRAAHKLDARGYVTTVECEAPKGGKK